MPRKPCEDKSCNCSCHDAKPKAPKKPPSAAQLAAREKFKQKVIEAKKLREKHPDWPMSKCMKEASSQPK
jgi:hypothetical protein